MIVDIKTVGEKIRTLRKQKGLTLADLAKKTSRSVSLLSQIENGNVSPSFSSMQTIADALESNLGQIVGSEPFVEADDSFLLEASARKVLSTQGGVQHQLLTHGMQLSFELVLIELPPDSSTGELLYTHAGEECGLLLEGSIIVETNEQVHHLNPGDSITLKSSIPHRLSNPGDKTAKAVWVNSAPYIFQRSRRTEDGVCLNSNHLKGGGCKKALDREPF